MKTKIIITLLMAFLAVSGINAKRRQLSVFNRNIPSGKIVAYESMEFIYDYVVNFDTLDNSSFDREQMLLQISREGISKFSSLRNYEIDSILPTLSPEEIVRNVERLHRGPSMCIFKNYPSENLTCADKICEDWFMYEEEIPKLDWELGDSVRVILGYECREARCYFRGRKWTAFYCEDIPVAEGPWKLHGLPGLIMGAEDSNKEYVFVCVGIRNNLHRPITIYDVPYNNTDRKKFYDTLHRYDTNPYSYAETVSGIHVTVTDESGNLDPTMYDPMELNYDYIERDWREE